MSGGDGSRAGFRRQLHGASLVLASAALLLGLLVLVGWHTGNRTLVQVLPSFVPMQYNTALGAAEYLTKPVDREHLLEVARDLTRGEGRALVIEDAPAAPAWRASPSAPRTWCCST